MAEHEPQAELDPLVASVAEGEAVDWDAAESIATESRSRRLRALKAVARLSALNESLQAGEDAILSTDLPPRAAAVAAEVAIGHWGPLELLEKVGAGASADVFRARDTRLDREVALKLLRGRGYAADRALQEGRLLARVRHPNVATVFGADVSDGQVGVWMEFVRGKTLQRLVEDQGPMAAKEAALVGVELCRALAAVHAQGVVHRDIKAQNAMRAEGGRILLVDFGIGLDLAAESAASATVSGTPVYLAPEVFEGAAATFRSDLYSLGVLLFFLVTGKFPVTGETIGALRERHRSGKRTLLRDLRPELPAEFVQAVERASNPDPAARYETAGAFEQALIGVLGDVVRGEAGAVSVTKSRAHWSMWKVRVGWTAAAAIVIGMALGVMYRKDLIREYFLWKADRLHKIGKRELEVGLYKEGLLTLVNDPLLLSRLADAEAGVGRYPESFANSQKAYSFRDRVSPLDQERITVSYYLNLLDYDKAVEAEMKVVGLKPSDDNALRDLAMFEMMRRNLPQAILAAESAIRHKPDDVINHGTLAQMEAVDGDSEAALAAVAAGQDKNGDLAYLHWGRGLALAVQGSYERAKIAFQKMNQAEHIYGSEGSLLEAQALILEGHLADAKNSLEAALEKDLGQGQEGQRAIRLARLAKLGILRGEEGDARRRARQLEAEVPDVPIFLKRLRDAALSYAELIDFAASERVLERIRKLDAIYSTRISGGILAQVEGEIARVRGDQSLALERLEAAREKWGDPETLYSLVRVKREAGLCREALEDTGQLLRMKGFILHEHSAILWKLAQLEEARCHRDLGELQPARDAYKAFLHLWDDNAPELPVVQEAKQELAALSYQ